ncbi:MAG: IS110 family transposase, partial [bacterium]
MSTITIGLDVGDRWREGCVLDAGATGRTTRRVRTTAPALEQWCGAQPASRVGLEVGTHSPWI